MRLATTNRQINISDEIALKFAKSTVEKIDIERNIAAAGCANPVALKHSLCDNELATRDFEDDKARYLICACQLAPDKSPRQLGEFAVKGLQHNRCDTAGVIEIAEAFCTRCLPCRLAEVYLSDECAKLARIINRQIAAAAHLKMLWKELEAA